MSTRFKITAFAVLGLLTVIMAPADGWQPFAEWEFNPWTAIMTLWLVSGWSLMFSNDDE